jgi:hypothetical protein
VYRSCSKAISTLLSFSSSSASAFEVDTAPKLLELHSESGLIRGLQQELDLNLLFMLQPLLRQYTPSEDLSFWHQIKQKSRL